MLRLLWSAISYPIFYDTFWLHNNSDMEKSFWFKRLAYKSIRLDKALSRVISRAKSHGLIFGQVEVYAVSGLLRSPKTMALNSYDKHTRSSVITVFLSQVGNFSDRDLEILLAHELGHTIDRYSLRRGHPFLERISKLDTETFADCLAIYLYSKEELLEVYNRTQMAYDRDTINRLEFPRPV